MSKFRLWKLLGGIMFILVVLGAVLFAIPKTDEVKLLYATNGDSYDTAAYGNFEQSLQANLRLERRALSGLSARSLSKYDAVYLDPALKSAADWSKEATILMKYTQNGGHLLLENSYAASFPPEFLGAKEVVTIGKETGAPADSPGISYPPVAYNLQGLQQVFQLFTDTYFKHNTLADLPGFNWGYGLVPDTAQTIVARNGLALCAVQQTGEGSVLLSSSFLPNRYFATGFDMTGGSDPAQGFSEYAAKYKAESKPTPGATYFNKRDLPLNQPSFSFSFAAANMEFRSEMLSYVSKEKLGYSIKKVLGPYGRPAMAFQNHFEAMPAIQQKDGIAWAELLKKYNEVPSFTLVRSSFYWGQWRESITAQLNTGTNEQPQFVGELVGSGYASGLHVMAGGVPLRQALFPEYRDLASAIERPYRAYPAAGDFNGDGRTDLAAGSADGFVYLYTNQGPDPAAYTSEPPPVGLALPDTFGAAQKLMLASGRPLQLSSYTTVHAADVNGDGRTDLIVSDESGAVLALPQLTGGSFGEPAAVRAGGKPLTLPGGAAAVAVADVNGDGGLDLAAGDAAGRVYLYCKAAAQPALIWQRAASCSSCPRGGRMPRLRCAT
ncbi:FG-GAP repeat domain-containing protein [Paenibacillus hexagrammi]|uniref:VCBS repeat-containing protein n=1 Tax=Paenibacillus hexagrammi TaxID=2908839 RepID=A0ABY3SIV2_9BACL|nr:VCBS repeat-containing protein [Paenibacillus sp. YPD9-1]UJF33159.1 VCBS repeat-containing protein [Paenibacillus sp. YPD9-1]